MKLLILRSVGAADRRRGGLDRDDLIEGAVVDVEKPQAEQLVKLGVAQPQAETVKGEAKAPEIKADKKS